MKHLIIPLTCNNEDGHACVKLYLQEVYSEIAIQKRPLVFICPGGGYAYTSEREAEPFAYTFLAQGYQAAILYYSCAPKQHPTQYLQAFEALKLIIDGAEEYNVDTERIVACGFSAGGHLAAMMGTGYNDPLILDHFKADRDFFKLRGMILAYPVITSGKYAHRGSFDNLLGEGRKDDPEELARVSIENRVTSETPSTFIWSTCEDGAVPCENTMLMADALRRNSIPFELHIFPAGGHGMALCNELTKSPRGNEICESAGQWTGLCSEWLKNLF